MSGYVPQYLAAASLVMQHLRQDDLEWIRVADPQAGRVDDFQIATAHRLDAYQMKWAMYPALLSFNDLISATDRPPLIHQLAEGWQLLKATHPTRFVVVHLYTCHQPS